MLISYDIENPIVSKYFIGVQRANQTAASEIFFLDTLWNYKHTIYG